MSLYCAGKCSNPPPLFGDVGSQNKAHFISSSTAVRKPAERLRTFRRGQQVFTRVAGVAAKREISTVSPDFFVRSKSFFCRIIIVAFVASSYNPEIASINLSPRSFVDEFGFCEPPLRRRLIDGRVVKAGRSLADFVRLRPLSFFNRALQPTRKVRPS